VPQKLAGVAGFEPTYGGIKTRAFTRAERQRKPPQNQHRNLGRASVPATHRVARADSLQAPKIVGLRNGFELRGILGEKISLRDRGGLRGLELPLIVLVATVQLA
jgi:hypothetical protein